MTLLVDARGKSCPEPVLLTKKALDGAEKEGITVLLDNPTSVENVKRFVEMRGYRCEVEEKDRVFRLTITRGGLSESM